MNIVSRRGLIVATVLAAFGSGQALAQQLPAHLANDPVAKALGAKIINAAIKEGAVHWYGGNTTRDFLKKKKKEFEKRFGIKINATTGSLRKMTQRVRTEYAVKKPIADAIAFNSQYMSELHGIKLLEKWRPPGKELANISPEVFVDEPKGYWWPAGLSAQALNINTDMVKKKDYPKSYWDLVNPKWKGKIVIRDPRSAGGGAWQMLHIYTHPDLGMKYIKELKRVVDPFILHGSTDQGRDAVLLGRFPIGFNGRGDVVRDLPKGAPIAFHVPKEGLAFTPLSMAVLKGSKRPNAAKVLLTWFYSSVSNLQMWSETSRPIAHPAIKLSVPERSVTRYPRMKAIPMKILGKPNFFFKEMEKVFGIR